MMTTQTSSKLSTAEEKLIQIVRTLSPERVTQLIDFAYFLTFLGQENGEAKNGHAGNSTALEAIRASEDKWDRLLARPEAKQLLHKMAQEALEEHRAGRTLDITVTDDERLVPG